ncbi:ABC transporter permease [Scrofimicrobium sp. R131]|uniref:ABC transporter permease n=1 Tax=Scrofimicrobium appendicitidis TaxID=3079930 RepID=A0AAU7V4F8_9ACTO
MITAVELGLIYSIMALGVYLTFRILEFADLTVDGSFTTGASVAAVGILAGVNPILSTLAAFVAGVGAGLITGLLNTKGNVDGLLAGILTQIGLYSINLRIMGTSNLGLLRVDTVFTPMREAGLLGTWLGPAVMLPFAAVVLLALIWFLHTDLGLAMRATGDSPKMISSFGVSTDFQKILGLCLSNGMVAVSGALIAQYQGFADVGMGIGMIVSGLASVIIGQAILGRLTIWRAATAVVVGAVLYRVVIQLALLVGFNPNDMKLISAVLVILALLLPQWRGFGRIRRALGLRWRSPEEKTRARLARENAALEED